MQKEGYDMMSPHKTLAKEVARRAGFKLGEDPGWNDRTIVDHVSNWLDENR
jgi:hypothetical protein